MRVKETQTFWSDAKGEIVVKERTLDVNFLGKKNGYKFYKVLPQLPEFIAGEILIDNCENMVFSKQVKTDFKDDIIHSNLRCISKNTWRGTSIETKNSENNGIEIKFYKH
jgi:hypothetical protein